MCTRKLPDAHRCVDMAERLNTLAHVQAAQSLSSTTSVHAPNNLPNFNPRSVSFDIRSPEELAAVNEFLITLGRDVTARQQNSAEYPAPQSYFDASGLSQLGLAGMPGVPGSGAGYHGDGGYGSAPALVNHMPNAYQNRAAHSSMQAMQYSGSMYPSLNEAVSQGYPSPPFSSGMRRPSLSPGRELDAYGAPRLYQPAPTSYLSIPQENLVGGASPHSSHSAMSTPPNVTPPHLNESLAAFDYMRPSRAPPAVQLAPVDYVGRQLRQVPLLRTAPGSEAAQAQASLGKPAPMEPKWDSKGPHRGPPARLTSASATSTSLGASTSLYPLLREGDEQYKLPPLQHRYRSPSPASTSTASPLSRASTISPPPSMMDEDRDEHDGASTRSSSIDTRRSRSSSASTTPSPPPTLPGIRLLAREVGRIALENHVRVAGLAKKEIPAAERAQHAELLRDMLMSINADYKRRFGTPPPARELAKGRSLGVERGRDVEMVAA